MTKGNENGEFNFEDFGLGGQDTDARKRREELEGGNGDLALVAFVGSCGAVGIRQVMYHFGVGRTAAYRRVAACIKEELLERVGLLREEPTLLRATPLGLRYAGLEALGFAAISPGSARHMLRCTGIALILADEQGFERVLSEREMRYIEREARRPIFSAKVGENPDGSPRLHRPDLGIVEGEHRAAVEIELSVKSPKRLAEIMRGWRRAGWVTEVFYFCESGGVHRAVSRAIQEAHVSDRVRVLEMRYPEEVEQ
jgi:hypothetical protein